jgi:hypothetical protein
MPRKCLDPMGEDLSETKKVIKKDRGMIDKRGQ